MTHAEWQDRISAFLDGELREADRRSFESHAEGCAECRRAVAEHRQVKEWLKASAARTTDADQPSGSTWESIRRVVTPRRRAHHAYAKGLAGALLAASIVVGAVLWRPLPEHGVNPADGVEFVRPAGYDGASRDLEAILDEHRDQLQPVTVKALEQSLATIDLALADAERALAADPVNDYVQRYVARLRATRLATLRHAVAIAQQ